VTCQHQANFFCDP